MTPDQRDTEHADPADTTMTQAVGTGDPRVDETLARLPSLDGLPIEDHVEVYEDIHQRLQDTLAEADGT